MGCVASSTTEPYCIQSAPTEQTKRSTASSALRRMVSHISIRKSSTAPSGRSRLKKGLSSVSQCSSSHVTSHASCLSPPHLPRSSTSITTECLEPQERIDTVPPVPSLSALNGGDATVPIFEHGPNDIGKDTGKSIQRENVVIVMPEGVDIEPEQVQLPASSSSSASHLSEADNPVEPSEVYSVLQRVMEFDTVEADSKAPFRVRSFGREDVQQGETIFQRVKHFERFAADRAKCLATKQCLNSINSNVFRTQSFPNDKSSLTISILETDLKEHNA